jgi:hypothetical protein
VKSPLATLLAQNIDKTGVEQGTFMSAVLPMRAGGEE